MPAYIQRGASPAQQAISTPPSTRRTSSPSQSIFNLLRTPDTRAVKSQVTADPTIWTRRHRMTRSYDASQLHRGRSSQSYRLLTEQLTVFSNELLQHAAELFSSSALVAIGQDPISPVPTGCFIRPVRFQPNRQPLPLEATCSFKLTTSRWHLRPGRE